MPTESESKTHKPSKRRVGNLLEAAEGSESGEFPGGRNAQEGKGSEASQDGDEHTHAVAKPAEASVGPATERSKRQERQGLVTGTDAANVKNPEGVKDKRGTSPGRKTGGNGLQILEKPCSRGNRQEGKGLKGVARSVFTPVSGGETPEVQTESLKRDLQRGNPEQIVRNGSCAKRAEHDRCTGFPARGVPSRSRTKTSGGPGRGNLATTPKFVPFFGFVEL